MKSLEFLCLLLASSLAIAVNGETDVLQLHGSGTTNPSKCYWLIMDQIMDRIKIPTRMTYRAVGSSTGQKEFKGVTVGSQEYVPTNDFGSGDIPISTDDYNNFTAAGIEIVHLPVVLGAISLFHSVPNVGQGKQGLNLTSCIIAKIFKREITTWDHDEIKSKNPRLSFLLPRPDFPIQVAHRKLGSSSTASVTQYLHESCPEEWPEELVGKTIGWPTDTLTCEGSAGMTDCIRDNEGTIGYIDSGHGHDQGLIEIELENADGTLLSSKEAAELGGIGSAALSVPDSPDKDFGGVDLLNKGGEYTWPIVAMSYIYVRKDLSHISSDDQALLVAFLKSLYEPDYIEQCEDLFGFIRAPDFLKTLAMTGIGMLNVTTDNEFSFESSTLANEGQGDYVVSAKRRSYAEYERSGFVGDVSGLVAEAAALSQLIQDLELKADSMKVQIETLEGEQKALAESVAGFSGTSTSSSAFTSSDETQITAALAMAAISIVCWAFLGLFAIKKVMLG